MKERDSSFFEYNTTYNTTYEAADQVGKSLRKGEYAIFWIHYNRNQTDGENNADRAGKCLFIFQPAIFD